MPTSLILGTAGHIDHGKTALVRALTGVDTDRLPEERKRGMTIELGFAPLEIGEFQLGVVDVPGHERFLRNMLAGATGIDLALLVVAADDSVKPQTREHLDILELIGVREGVIALSKCDVADPEWLDLVEQEVRDLVGKTSLSSAPIVRTSAQTGEGIDALRKALAEAAARAERQAPPIDGTPFRLAIDRCFTLAGHGTIVTGSVLGGAAHVGDSLVVEPGGHAVRVKSIQSHDQSVEQVHRGQRAALNLTGIRHDAIQLGHELAAGGHLRASRRMTVRLKLLPSAPRRLKHRARVRVHLGTAELMAGVVLLDRDQLDPGDEAFAQLHLAAPAVAVWNQPLVLRAESPVVTIGGGHVLEANAGRLRRRDEAALAQLPLLAGDDPQLRAHGAIYLNGLAAWEIDDRARMAGVRDAEALTRRLLDDGQLTALTLSASRRLLVSSERLAATIRQIETALGRLHERDPLEPLVPISRLLRKIHHLADDEVLRAVMAVMETQGRLERAGQSAALPGRGPQLSGSQKRRLEEIVEAYLEGGFRPPTVAELEAQATRLRAQLPQLIDVAAGQGRLVAVGPGLYLHREFEEKLRDRMCEGLAEADQATVADVRKWLGTTRKFAVPFCEYLDRIGLTRRVGDNRVLAEAAPSPGTEATPRPTETA